MKRLTMVLLLFALTFATSAWAAPYTYAQNWNWQTGWGGGSAFSSRWWQNGFGKDAGAIGTVTFIDNVSYGWHVTVRNDSEFTATQWFSSQVKKGHCRANSSGFSGVCSVFD